MSKKMAEPLETKKKEERAKSVTPSESEEEADDCEEEKKEEYSEEDEAGMNSKGGAGPQADAFAVDFSEVQEMRREQKVQFKELDQTKEYAETQYYKVKFRNESQNLFEYNLFWADLASHIARLGSFAGFATVNFITAVSNINEIIFVLATLDLPFTEESHGLKSERGRKVEIKAASNLLMFTK